MDLKLIGEHRRLAILRHLAGSANYTSNLSILGDVLRGVGLGATEDQMRSTLAWLEEQELVELRHYDEGLVLAAATARGVEVARGEAVHPGVRRPSAR